MILDREPPEQTLLDLRPGWAFILLHRFNWLVGLGMMSFAGLALLLWSPFEWVGSRVIILGTALQLLVLVIAFLEWLCERYQMTPQVVRAQGGVLRRWRFDAPLRNLESVVVYRSIGERIFSLGTVSVTTAAGAGTDAVWRMVRTPHQIATAIRDRALLTSTPMPAHSSDQSTSASDLPVIGLAGGIGAGKSLVGSILRSLGCLVIDSDARAKAALDRPDVRDQLVLWWGDGVLDHDGRIDRSKIAAIIFDDPQQRQRLEALVHPIVRQDRAAAIAEARRAEAGGPPVRAVVIDAPLLFEAGVDRECDAVIFVDAPPSIRQDRVKSRGWNEAELRRREVAQLPLEEKRRRATHIVSNAGSREELEKAVADVLDKITLRE